MKKLAVLVSALVVTGVNFAYAGDGMAVSDKDFLQSFSSSFMDACEKSSTDSAIQATCQCVLKDLVNNFSVAELHNTDKLAEYVKTQAMPKCRQ